MVIIILIFHSGVNILDDHCQLGMYIYHTSSAVRVKRKDLSFFQEGHEVLGWGISLGGFNFLRQTNLSHHIKKISQ